MGIENNSGCLKIAISFLVGLAAFISWAEFLFKPIRYYAITNNYTAGDIFSDLIMWQPGAYDWPLSGYAFLISSAILLYVSFALIMRPIRSALDFIESSEAPISILESTIEIYVDDREMKRSIVKRSQILHSNNDDVDAYYYSQKSTNGKIDSASLRIESRINGKKITKELLKRGNENSLDTIEIFDRKLPTNFFATYLPDMVVRFLFKNFKIFSNYLVVRESSCRENDEYSVGAPVYQLTATRYPASHIVIYVNFPVNSIFKPDTLKAFLIMSHAVSEITVAPVNDDDLRSKFRLEIGKLKQQQSIRVMWENEV